jgi:hypothetical protein
MSGALKSVFGGGNIFGSLLSIAGMFFPPLAIASSLSNMLTQAIGQAVKQAVSTLIQEFAAPKFLQGIANALVDQVVGGQQKPSDANVDAFTNDKFGKEVTDWTEQLTKDLVSQTKDRIQAQAKKTGGKASAGSWLEALSRALGEVAGEKAAKMVELSNKLTDLSKSDKKEDAKEMTAVSQELSGVSKIFQLLQDAANTTIKGIGDGLATAARKS